MSEGWTRLNGPARTGGIDLARGLAVLGMLAAHLLLTSDRWLWTDAATWVSIVNGRSSILFATLAGLSIGLVTGGAVPQARAEMAIARRRLAARAGMLWGLGVLLILTEVPVHVILPAYGILFLLALPFTALRSTTLLGLATGIACAMPFVLPLIDALPFWQTPLGAEVAGVTGWNYPFPLWVAFVLAGLACARAGVRERRVQWRMLLGGAAVAAFGYALARPLAATGAYWGAVWSVEPHSGGLPEVVGSAGFAIAVIGACLLLCTRADAERLTVIGWAVLPLRAVGSMPLSAYTAQLVVWAVAASVLLGNVRDLAGFRALEPFWPMTFGILAGCTAWALLLGRGPLEWGTARVARILVPGR